jgi:hypothetical protein
LSVAGVNGGISAANGGDVGSPGTIVNLPAITSLVATNGAVQLTWSSQSNYTYAVQFKNELSETSWTTLTNLTAGDNVWSVTDFAIRTQRFYRVILNP